MQRGRLLAGPSRASDSSARSGGSREGCILSDEQETGDVDASGDLGGLGSGERWGAVAAGVPALVAGGAAVFLSGNGAGTAILLVLAAALLLIGIQGTPLIRIGGEQASIELERRRRAERLIKEAASGDPDTARDVIEAVLQLEPAARPRAESTLAALTYEEDVLRELRRVLQLPSVPTSAGQYDRGIDAILVAPGGKKLEVLIKYFRSPLDSRRRRELMGLAATGKLVITNADVDEATATAVAAYDGSVVTWRDPGDTDRLKMVAEDLLRR